VSNSQNRIVMPNLEVSSKLMRSDLGKHLAG
jgi:hypothetical protein